MTYSNPAGVLDTDTRVGQQITVRALYHQDLIIPLIAQLAAEGRQRAPRPDVRDHDGHQLMHAVATARREDGTRGQVIVIFALSLVVIMAAAGLAFDIGRFYSERRFLQNAADAGALAIANALIRGESNADAEAEGRDVLVRNLAASPTGTAALVATTPQYAPGHAGSPAHLTSGVLITSSGDVRVAVKSDVTYTFGRVIGLGSAVVSGQARVATKGDLLPIAVRHYVNAPGPVAGAVAPCDGNENHFQDLVSTANTSCLGTVTDRSLRSTPQSRRTVQSVRRRTTTRPTTDRSSPSSARAPRRRTRRASAGSSPSTSATSSTRRRRRTCSTTASRPA